MAVPKQWTNQKNSEAGQALQSSVGMTTVLFDGNIKAEIILL